MLYPYQQAGAEWLARQLHTRTPNGVPQSYLAAHLGDPPGLGKTRTLIRGLQEVGAHRPLVVCPAIVRTHWRREFEALGWKGAEPRVYSYEQIQRGGNGLMKSLVKQRCDSLLLDEAHLVRNPEAQRTQQLLGRDGYALRFPLVWLASGTPMWKHPGDLWTMLTRLFPQVLQEHGFKKFNQFLDHFCSYYYSHYGLKVAGVKHEDELKQLLGRIMLRRTLDEVGIELPQLAWSTTALDAARTHELIDLQASPELAPLVKALEAGEPLEDHMHNPATAKLRRLIGECKAPAVVKMLREQLADTDESVVVFAHHRSVLEILRDGLADFGVSYVDGDTSEKLRDSARERFQKKITRVFVGQIIACQTGITLTAARRAVLVEPDWSAVVNFQAAMRVCRIGQTASSCLAQMVALAETLDDAIVRQNEREARMAEAVFG